MSSAGVYWQPPLFLSFLCLYDPYLNLTFLVATCWFTTEAYDW